MSDHFDRAIISQGKSADLILQSFLTQLSKVSDSDQDNFKILDLGSGTGDLCKLILQKIPKAIVHTCDIVNYSGATPGEKHFVCNLNEEFSEEIPDKDYDFVVSSEVIEHLENPRAFLRSIERLIKPGGEILLSTPNPESITSLISLFIRGYHSAFGPRDYPAHITSLSLYDLKNIVTEIKSLSFETAVFIKNGRIPGSALHWHTILPFLNGKRFSDNYLVKVKKKK